MNSALQVRLLHAIGQCLRPLARILLRAGINYKQFSELAKLAFVQEAQGERDARGRTTNSSRIAIRTGISRKEVARLKSRLDDLSRDALLTRETGSDGGHAARVLQLWHSDQRFLRGDGCPKPLPFGSSDVCFSTVVKAAGGDFPPGAVRAELLDAGAIVEIEHDLLMPIKRHFVPANFGEDLLVGFTHILLPVLEGLSHNTDEATTAPFVQRFAFSDRLMNTARPLFREVAQVRAEEFLQSVDDWLVSNELPAGSRVQQEYRAGLGVFFYEGAQTSPVDAAGSTEEL